MILVTGCNERYFLRMCPYLNTLKAYADFPYYLACVGFFPHDYDCEWFMLTQEANAGSPPETESIQHGSFIHCLDCDPSEVVMYTDGDFILQRPFEDEEREFFNLQHGEIAVGYNGGAGESLLLEAGRIGMRKPVDELVAMWGDIDGRPIYNAGCIAMTAQTWAEFHARYMESWDVAGECFTHQARQQWLMSWLISEYYTVKVIPWSIHAHGHHGMKPGMTYGNGRYIYIDGELALFRHFL